MICSPSLVRQPLWTRPSLVEQGASFDVVLSHPCDDAPHLSLVRERTSIPVQADEHRSVANGRVSWRCGVDGGVPAGLYDLEMKVGNTECTVHGGVCVVTPDVNELTLIHCSDLHLLKPMPEGMQDRTALVESLLSRIKELGPDLVVITGDLITRYDEAKRPLPASTIRWQIAWLREHLPGLDVPLYVTVGNHDVAFDATRPDWYAAMGGGRRGATDDFSLDWGCFHLTMMDCFAHYDDRNSVLATSFMPQQLDWLADDLRAAASSAKRLLFLHYDYHRQLPDLLDGLPVDMMFYGHSKGMYPEVLAQYGVWDGHLAGSDAYDWVHLRDGDIRSERVAWTSLGA